MKIKNIIVLILSIAIFQCCINREESNQLVSNVSKLDALKIGDTAQICDTIVYSKVKKNSGEYLWIYDWNKYVSDEILKHKEIFIGKDSIYKQDLDKLYPNYFNCTEKEKIALWTLLFASIAKYESNFNPNCRFHEPPPLNTYSEGLLQLSYGDETRYNNVPLDSQKQNILLPEVNLKTGVVIFAKQLEKRKSIFTNSYFYWSVLSNKQNEIIRFFQDKAAELNTPNK